MVEYDKERKQWQFISDENDIETIIQKLDSLMDMVQQSAARELWLGHRTMRLTLAFGEGLNGTEVDVYNKLFNAVKEIPKE